MPVSFLVNPYRFTFLPTSISGCGLWLDASDSASVTHVSNAVSQINDKSGNGNHAVQATAARKPTYGTDSTSGLGKITFDGSGGSTGDLLSIPHHSSITFTSMSAFWVGDVTTAAAYGRLFTKDDTTSTTQYSLNVGASGHTDFGYFTINNASTKWTSAGTGTGRHLIMGMKNSTGIYGYKDSTTEYQFISYAGGITSNTKVLTIGASDSGNYGFAGSMFE